MKLIDARRAAITLARAMPMDGTVCIYRVAPREFEIAAGIEPDRKNIVQMIHTSFVRDGFYKEYYPSWIEESAQSKPARDTAGEAK